MIVQARLGHPELRCDIRITEAVVAFGLRQLLRDIEDCRGGRSRRRAGCCEIFLVGEAVMCLILTY